MDNKISSFDALIDGCTVAAVSYYVDKNYEMRKVIVLSEESEFWLIEDLLARMGDHLHKREEVCVTKNFIYDIMGKYVKRWAGRFFTVYHRTLSGFVVDEFTHDARDQK